MSGDAVKAALELNWCCMPMTDTSTGKKRCYACGVDYIPGELGICPYKELYRRKAADEAAVTRAASTGEGEGHG